MDVKNIGDLSSGETGEALESIRIEVDFVRYSALDVIQELQAEVTEQTERIDSQIAIIHALRKEKEQEAHNLRAAHNTTRKELAYRCQIMRDIARLLAECGGCDHRTKNEVILRVVAMLLTYDNPVTEFTRNMDNGDIPF